MIKDALKLFHEEWALVTAGKEGDYNTMTISWGGLGTLWSKPVTTVYVKPCRYTFGFMQANDYFTVSFFDSTYKKDLTILGTASGRDGDKVALTSLHPVFLENGVTFKEAKTTIVCKKTYELPLVCDGMSDEIIEHYYTKEEPHHIFLGEVLEVLD